SQVGYNRKTPLERLSTRRKKRRNAIAMKLWQLTPPRSHHKATKARRGHGLPYRLERRLVTTEAARARVAAGFRQVKSRKFQTRPKRRRPPALNLTSTHLSKIVEFCRFGTKGFGRLRSHRFSESGLIR